MSPIAGKMSEAELQSALVRCAKEQGWLDHRAWSSMHSPRGWPDVTFARGLFLCVWELKNASGKATPEQIKWLDWWAQFAHEVHSVHAMAQDHPAAPTLALTVHVALVRPQDLDAAYWLLCGQRPSEAHPWPAPWDPSDPQRGRPSA